MKTIVLESLWEKPYDGWAIATRAYARALASAGYDVRLKSFMPEPELSPETAAEVPEKMRTPVGTWDAHVFSTTLGGSNAMHRAGTFQLLEMTIPRPRLFYTMFERCDIQPDLAKVMNAVLDGLWVPCRQNRDALERAGCEHAVWIPPPFFPDDPHLGLPPPPWSDAKTFLWIGRWEPRKRPEALIEAFMSAFRPGEAKLVLKLGPSPWVQSYYPEPEKFIEERFTGGRHDTGNGWTPENSTKAIEIIRATLSAEEMLALHARADVYVSPSRGEGIDLPAFHAKLAGRRLVVTESGGPLDFVGEGDFVVPSIGEIAAPEYAWIWDEGATLIDYSTQDLTSALQDAANGPPPKRDPETLKTFEARAVARRFRRWLNGVFVR